mgnify:CR=1 FL=1|jgi:phi13 family phage major tail protein
MSETVTQVSETEQKIVRSRTCGCRDFYIAKLTQNDAKAYVAETPVKLARAIKAKVDEKWSSEKIYSDDGTEEVINSYEGTEIELEVNALAPQDRQILFGQLYENGFLVKTADDKAPEVAVGWRERKLNGKYDFKWLYAGKFAEGISEEASTKEGKLSPTTKSIKVHSMREVLTMRMRFRSTNQTSFPETQRQQRQSRHGSAKCRRKTAV